MPLTLVSGPRAEPVAVAEAKHHLRVTLANSDNDALIGRQIAAARRLVENFTCRALVLQTFEQAFDRFPRCIYLERGPARAVESITYIDAEGNTQTLATTEYTVDLRSVPARIVEAYGKTWPLTRADTPNTVIVKYRAGHLVPFTVSSDSPGELEAAGHPYSDGDVLQLSNTGGSLPTNLSALTDYYALGVVAGESLQLAATENGDAIEVSGGSGTHFLGVLDEDIRHALLLILAELYERREDAIVGAAINEVPRNAQRMLWPHRLFPI